MDSNYVKLQEFVGQIEDLSSYSLCFCREIQVQTMLEPAECRRLGSICNTTMYSMHLAAPAR